MKVTTSGYFSRDGRFERGLKKWAEKYAPLVLGGTRVESVNVTFYKRKIDWSDGYRWLLDSDNVEIKVPYLFREHFKARWLILHEMCHALQMCEGRLGKSLEYARYRSKRGKTRHFRVNADGMFVCKKTGREYEFPPWELEVHSMSQAFLRKKKESIVKKAWTPRARPDRG